MKPGRNDPCPCGSGKKYKHCCGALLDQPAVTASTPTPSERDQLIALFNGAAYAELEARLNQMIARYPDSGFLWKVSGATLQALGKDCLPALARAAELMPDDVEAHNNLANQLLRQGQIEQAVTSLRRVVALNPDLAEVHNRLGAALQMLGRYEEAASSCRQALQLKPDFAEAHNNLGAALQELGKPDDASESFRRAVALNPGYALAHNNLGAVLYKLGRLEQAEACYRQALALKPDYPEAYNNLGITLLALGQPAQAMDCYRHALELHPDYADALSNMGDALQSLGQFDDAVGCWRQVLALNPEHIEVRRKLAEARKVSSGDENFRALVALHESAQNGGPGLPDEEAISLNFALGKCCEDTGDYDKAFSHFLHGSRLKRATITYAADETTQLMDQLMGIFDVGTINRLHGSGDPSRLPIFVLGMPRSGTTLIEQILSSHRDVHGAGELPDLIAVAHEEIDHVRFPDNLRLLDQPRLAAWGAEYIARLKRRAPDMPRITDKAPINFLVVGLIHLMLPNARIIHVKRNPVDCCVSCFTQLFATGQDHSYDLTELGCYYRDYSRLMEHWRRVLPQGAFLDVQYEDVIADTETQARRIIEYCGLEWDAACLEFYKNKRQVMTASDAQVRQPVYSSSVGRWSRYEKFLAPLLDALGDLAQ